MFKRGSKPILWSVKSKEEQLSSTRAAALGLCIQGIPGIPCNLLGVRGGLVNL